MKLPLLPRLGPLGLRLALRRRSRNSIIIGGPLGWRWVPHLDEQHHGALSGPPGAHRHADIAGVGPDDHHARDHHARHEDGGADQIDVSGLGGLLADPQAPLAHAASHEDGGIDEISVAGLSGLLADPQTPVAHQLSHQSGGIDALAGPLDANGRLMFRRNTGADVGPRRRLNLIEGANVTLGVADSAPDEEVQVTIAAAGGGDHSWLRHRLAGNWHGPIPIPAAHNQQALANSIYAVPFPVVRATTIVEIGIRVVTAAAGSARLGVFGDNGATYPGTLLLDCGTVDVSAAGDKSIVIALGVPANCLVWPALLSDVTATYRAYYYYIGGYAPIGSAGPEISAMAHSYRAVYAYGALPAAFPAGASPLTGGTNLLGLALKL